jgi:multiple sugar transport system permease protein
VIRTDKQMGTQKKLISPRRHHVSRTRQSLKGSLTGYGFVAPAGILFVIFYFIPFIRTLINSFYQFNIMSTTKSFDGLKNYESIIRNGDFQSAIWHTVVYTIFTVFFSTVLALLIAVLMNQRIRGRNIYRMIYFLPVIAPSVATSIVFSDIFSNNTTGVANQILAWFHIQPVAWLGSVHFAMGTVIIYSVWSLIGYNMLLYLAGLQNIDESYYEAARLDGASSWALFRKITIPLITPTTIFVVVIGVIEAFRVFNQVYIMTQGGPINATTVIVYYIYREAFVNFQGGTASAMSVVLFLMLLILTIIQIKFFSRKGVE